MYGLYRGNKKTGFKIQPNRFLNILMSRHISRCYEGKRGKEKWRGGWGEGGRKKCKESVRTIVGDGERERDSQVERERGKKGESEGVGKSKLFKDKEKGGEGGVREHARAQTRARKRVRTNARAYRKSVSVRNTTKTHTLGKKTAECAPVDFIKQTLKQTEFYVYWTHAHTY